jgi:hypothetical protein
MAESSLPKKLFLPCRRDTWIRRRVVAIRLVEETEAHVVVGLLLLCRRNLISKLLSRLILILQCQLTLLLLLLSGRGVSGTSSGGSATGGGGGTTTRADVQEQVLDVLALEGLGEESGPDGLNLGDLGGGDERLELVGLFAKSCVSRMFGSDDKCGIAWFNLARAMRWQSLSSSPSLLFFVPRTHIALLPLPSHAPTVWNIGQKRTVISRPSSARMRAA